MRTSAQAIGGVSKSKVTAAKIRFNMSPPAYGGSSRYSLGFGRAPLYRHAASGLQIMAISTLEVGRVT